MNFFYLDLYLYRRQFFLFRSVSVSISIIWHAGLFFRSYSGNLPAMFIILRHFCFYSSLLSPVTLLLAWKLVIY